jgi:hypothetical protein
MTLIDNEAAKLLPPLYSQERIPDPQCVVKLFCPWAMATWWLTEYDPEKRLAFGFCLLNYADEAELGYVSIDELEMIRGPGGLTIERDLYWSPIPLSEVQRQVRAMG